MTQNTLRAVSTEDLLAMRARAYRNIWAACKVSDARQGPRVEGAAWELAFLRYDDELELRGIGGYSPRA